MGRRNWCSVDWEDQTGELIFDVRVEVEKGCGVTVGYVSHTLHRSSFIVDFIDILWLCRVLGGSI